MIGGVAVKGAFKLGTIIVPTAYEALQAYKLAHPIFAACYDQAVKIAQKVIDKYKSLDAAGDRFIKESLGKGKEKLWGKSPEGFQSAESSSWGETLKIERKGLENPF